MAQYLVQFVIDTDDGVTEESKKGNSLYVRDWFNKLTAVVASSNDIYADVLAPIDPYYMKLMSVANLAFLPKQVDKKWYQFWK